MNTALPRRGLARHIAALSTSVAAVTLVTLAIYALDSVAPALSLGVLYVFAVLPVAVLFGLGWALPVSVASILAFNWPVAAVGDPTSEIRAAAEQSGAGVIVVGRGSGLRRLIDGSVSARLVRRAPCDVLVVR